MNKVKTTIVAAVFAVAGVMMLSPVASAKTEAINQADIAAIERFEREMSESWQQFRDNLELAVGRDGLEKMRFAIENLTRHQFSTKLGPEYTAATNKYRNAADSLKKPLHYLHSVMTGPNLRIQQDAYEKFETALGKAEDEMKQAIDEMNQAVDKANSAQSTPYLWALIGTAVLAVASAAWAFMKREATPELTKHRRGVAFASIWPLLGAGITYGTFAFADKLGGKFYIMYGLILFGLVAYVSAVANYLKARKAGTGHNQTPPAMPQA